MFKIYVYIFDTLADWELGYVTAELNSGRFFKKVHQEYQSKQSVFQKSQSKQWVA